jgi:succinylglutamate desuccinylase
MMFEEVIKINGKNGGPTSIILAGVHGNEQCGIEAFKKILPELKIDKGSVFFIYGNPRAIAVKKRFTETNLNRMFKNENSLSAEEKNSYEYQRAQFLKNYLNQADVLLDIHASGNPESYPFAICEKNSKEIVKYLPIETVVSGFDNVEPGGTDYYMNSIGKIGICIECGYLGNPESENVAIQSIDAFLKARGHITNDIPFKKQSEINMYDLYYTKTDKFTLSKPFKDFEQLTKGQIIGTDGETQVLAKNDGIILFACNRSKIGDEAFLFGKKL